MPTGKTKAAAGELKGIMTAPLYKTPVTPDVVRTLLPILSKLITCSMTTSAL